MDNAFTTMMKTRLFVLVLLFVSSSPLEAAPLVCIVKDDNTVVVEMKSPHPKQALVQRPDGTTVWLQAYDELAHEQIENFESLEEWTITSTTPGTVYVDGEPVAEPVIRGSGRYNLYIADNTETEPENTYFIECYFEIGK